MENTENSPPDVTSDDSFKSNKFDNANHDETVSNHKLSCSENIDEMIDINNPDRERDIKMKEITDDNTIEGQNDEVQEPEEWLDILGSGELKKKVLKSGISSQRPEPTDICEIRLIGKLLDETIVEKETTFKVQISEGDVCQGIDLALPLMELGEISLIHIGPRFAYGSLGLAPNIPPNATVLYELELLKIEEEPALDSFSFAERRSMSNKKRERGNWWYSRDDPTKAIQCYRRALQILEDVVDYTGSKGQAVETIDDDLVREHVNDRIRLYNNLAAAQIAIKAYDTALGSVQNVLRHDSKNVKALFRNGKILAAIGRDNEAIKVLKIAEQLEPENMAIKKELLASVERQMVDKQLEKILFRKMLGQVDDNTQSNKSKKDEQPNFWTSKLKRVATATVIASLAIALGYRFKSSLSFADGY